MLLCFVSCAEKTNKEITLDVDKVAEELYKRLSFDDEMVKLDSERAGDLYGFEADECAAYAGTGATPEMISVAHYSSIVYLNNASEQIYRFLDTQKEDFSSYAPIQVPKIEKAAVKIYGSYLICVVSATEDSDGLIETVMDKYMS